MSRAQTIMSQALIKLEQAHALTTDASTEDKTKAIHLLDQALAEVAEARDVLNEELFSR